MIDKEKILLGLALTLPFGVLVLGVVASQPNSPAWVQKTVGVFQFFLILSIPVGLLLANRRSLEAPTVFNRSKALEKAPNDSPLADRTSPLLV
jgi:hypothetical protein